MLKRTALILLAASIFASPALASPLGATFSTSVQYHGFTLRAARAATSRFEHGDARIGRCDWTDRRHASCRVSQHPSEHLSIGWIDLITRLGQCTNHHVYTGRHCFTGPLTVQAIDRQEWYRS